MRGDEVCRLRRLVGAFLFVVAATSPSIAMEGIQGAYLKGYRDFMTGVLGSPGVHVRYDLYSYQGSEQSTVPQGQLRVGYQSTINILGATVVTPFRLFDADYAFAVRGAYSFNHADQSVTPPRTGLPTTIRSGDLTAFHDLVVSPLFLGWHAGNWHWNFATSVWLPVGNYQQGRLVNTGRNTWAWAPQLGVTYLDPKTGWEISGAATYVVSEVNPATSYRSGNLFYFDYAAGRMLTENVKLGIVGYYVQQTTPDNGSGATAGDRMVRVLGLGPGATFTFRVNERPIMLVAKYYREFGAQNTTQGDAGFLSARFSF